MAATYLLPDRLHPLLTGFPGYAILEISASQWKDSISLRAIGVILKISYRLRRHYWLGLPLAYWFALLMFVAALGALLRWRSFPWPAVALAGLVLAYALTLFWASRQGYARFVASLLTDECSPGHSPVPLPSHEAVPMRTTGWFEVEGEKRYLVDLEADFETAGTREHIVMGRIHPSRFLLFGTWPKRDLGWWYIFFQPSMIRQMHQGTLYHGFQPRPAIGLVYEPDPTARQTVYLTFYDKQALYRVWDDLLVDAPQGIVD
jgi:hypothetical protein